MVWLGCLALGILQREVVRLVDGLRARGAKLVLVTGSFSELVEPIARELFAHHAITAPLERQGGVFTGRLLASPTIGPGKAQAVERYAREAGVPLARCFALGDDVSDIPFLELAGRVGVPSDGDPELVASAKARGWTVIDIER